MFAKTKIVLLAATFAAMASAQPVVNAVVNSAKYGIPGLPGYGVAQGSMATAFGTGFPAQTLQVSKWPLDKNLGGVTIQITVGGTTVDAYPLILQGANQMTFLVASNTPVGDGTIIVTVNGQASAPGPITVLASNFGMFSTNFSGQGPGVFLDPLNANAAAAANALTHSARSNDEELWDIWGTGLGKSGAGDETAGPIAGNIDIPVTVWVGGKQAEVVYKGRSGCCAGIDQIRIKVPEGLSGCYVPVMVQTGSGSSVAVSNTVTMSVAQNGGTCSDPNGLSADDINRVSQGGTYKVGSVFLSRVGLKFTLPAPLGEISGTTDTGSGSFYRYDIAKLASSSTGLGTTQFGACTVFTAKGGATVPTDITKPTPLDAGASLTLQGPNGTKQLAKETGGIYGASLGGGFNIPGVPGGATPPYLDQGTYTVTGPGGADVGPFTATLVVPAPLTWTNMNDINNVPRSQALHITWTGGGANDYVTITGASTINPDDQAKAATAGFVCYEKASAGQFDVPAAVLLSLPANPPMAEGDFMPTGFLMVGSSTNPVGFTASGLDKGTFSSTVLSEKPVSFQ